MTIKPLIFLLIPCAIACRKNDCPPETSPTPPPASDIPAVKLRAMNISSLPSPYYQFSYNDSGYITQLNHASGLAFYDITYANRKIHKIFANKDVQADINKDVLEYEYSQGLPVTIRVLDKQNKLYRICRLQYGSENRLQKLTWEVDPGTGMATEQTLTPSYYEDGNLKEIVYRQFAVPPSVEYEYVEHFEEYDNKENPDGFALLHTTLHHPVLLPAIRLQRNNAARVYRTSTNSLTFDARYSFTYDAQNRPLSRIGPVSWRAADGTTGQYQSTTTFTY
ncbi:hypothetical protein [Paraflavitalea sp. CAU 1676]|uniref:hypothetical protein n=1 Tax=Paraflavitalea sp. CAU 1676 TaxID=3032598 RepID=UPI0023DA7006|nr:hypothetical protein [Paraflavitalea sp. CAU 1676]MDF2187827.1 hypothetical protein [Paraflavitalea sp. CAU 1676]